MLPDTDPTLVRCAVAVIAIAQIACTTGGVRRPADGGGARAPSPSDGGPVLVARADASLPHASDCTEAARWIYLVDATSESMLRFEPDSRTLSEIGPISCSTAPGITPFSMAVDRHANALVLYTDHRLYQVSTTDASCTETAFEPDRMGFELFGMGFVADAAGSTAETLFIGGGPAADLAMGSSTLATLSPTSWTISPIGELDGSPELTGTGDGELWAFLPDAPMAVQQLDRATGDVMREIDVSRIDPDTMPGGWAFAFWGGRYYVFYAHLPGTSTSIYSVTPESGEVEDVLLDTGLRIVGAGVSTCAPTDLI